MRSFRESNSKISLVVEDDSLSIPLERFCEYEPYYQSSFGSDRVYKIDDGVLMHYLIDPDQAQRQDTMTESMIEGYLSNFDFYASQEKHHRQ